METKYKISIPEPCQENWDKMTPKDNGRFCMSCTKTVVDFTEMLPEEIQQYFILNKNFCGRFRNAQLESIIIQIPDRVLYSQTQYHKIFLLALFITMGTTLFSCTNKKGEKQKIDKVQITNYDSLKENKKENKIAYDNNPAHPLVPPPPPPSPPASVNKINVVGEAGIVQTSEVYTTGVPIYTPADDQTADYPGGKNKFYAVFKRDFKMPEEASNIKGELAISFMINRLGKIENIKTEKDLGHGLAEEGERILSSLPRCVPALINGKTAASTYTVLLKFDSDFDSQQNETNEFKSQIVSIKLTPEFD